MPIRRALAGKDNLPPDFGQYPRLFVVFEQLHRRRTWIGADANAGFRAEGVDNVLKITIARPDDRGLAQCDRLDRITAGEIDETSPDDDDIRQRIGFAKFAERVEEEDFGAVDASRIAIAVPRTTDDCLVRAASVSERLLRQ